MKWVWLIISLAIANPVLYLVSIGLGVGSYIDKNTGGMGVDGVSYITFLAPALLATAAIQGAIDESVYPTLEGFKWNKTFFSMNSTPLSGNHIAMGVFFNSLIRVVFTAVMIAVKIANHARGDSRTPKANIFHQAYPYVIRRLQLRQR